MKNFRFLSSLAVAGMLTTSIMGTTLAAEGDVQTRNLGTYKVADKAATAFILDNIDDKVTMGDLKASDTFKDKNITADAPISNDTVLGTGSKFKVDDKEYVVVVYGDVNGSGTISIDDVVKVAEMEAELTEATDAENEAADVANDDNKVTIDDVVKIAEYETGYTDKLVDPEPEMDKENPPVQSQYDFTVNENNTVNDTNSATSTMKITTEKKVDKLTKFQLVYINKEGKESDAMNVDDLQMNQYADEADVAVVDFTSMITAMKDVNENVLKDKKITLKLKSEDGKEVLATTEITVNTVKPEAAKISAKREGTEQARLKFEAKSGSDIVKVYYTVEENENAETNSKKFMTAEKDNVKLMTVSGNSFDSVLDGITSLVNNTKYVVNFVVENAVGNYAENVYHAVVPKDSSAKQEEKVTNLKINDNLSAEWTAPTVPPTNYTVIVYNEAGEVIGEINNVTETTQTLATIVKEKGKYSVSVISNGDKINGTSADSEETEKVEFEVTQLAEVTGIHFETNEETDEVYLKWDEYSDVENEAFNGYTIKIYEYDPINKNYKQSESSKNENITKNLTEIKLSDVHDLSSTFTPNPNIRYKAVISANSSKGKVISSKPTETEKDYFNLVINTLTPVDINITDTSMKLPLTTTTDTTLKALGNEVTYDVEVWSKTSSSTAEEHFAREDDGVRKNVTVDKNGDILIDGLKPYTEYKFVLVVHIDGDEAEGRSKISSATAKFTKKTLPSLEGKVVIKTATDKKATEGGKVYAGSNKEIYIDGVEVDTQHAETYYDPMKLLSGAPTGMPSVSYFIRSLNEGDTIVSMTEDKIKVKAANVATSGNDRQINAQGRVVEIIGNNYEQDIKAVSENAKEIILNGGLFKINKESTSKFTLENGVKVKTDISSNSDSVKVNVVAGASATIDDIEIHSTAALDATLSIASSKRVLTVKEVGNDTISINNKSGNELIVEFDGDATIGKTQVGKVTIESNADVTIKATEKANVGAELSIATTNGSITFDTTSQGQLTGTKEITVSTTAESVAKTITARTKLTSPIDLSNKEILPYTIEQLKALRDEGTVIKDSAGETIGALSQTDIEDLNNDKLTQLVNYFNAFGSSLMSIGAKVSNVTANQEGVTITLPAGSVVTLDSVTIGGLK